MGEVAMSCPACGEPGDCGPTHCSWPGHPEGGQAVPDGSTHVYSNREMAETVELMCFQGASVDELTDVLTRWRAAIAEQVAEDRRLVWCRRCGTVRIGDGIPLTPYVAQVTSCTRYWPAGHEFVELPQRTPETPDG